MHVHMVAVSGTGMGALAALFREGGHRVTGSDVTFDPPMGPALAAAGVECLTGFATAHVSGSPPPDLVVVGNAVRRDNVEALEAERLGLRRTSMSGALREHFLAGRRPVVVAGTHGKTTTSAMVTTVLRAAGLEPGWFIGGVPKDLPAAAAMGGKRSLTMGTGPRPFVVEGDEYDAVFWHKAPKFLDYVGVSPTDVAVLTSVEHDHIDIYPDAGAYEEAFRAFLAKLPPGGLLVCDSASPRVRALAKEAPCNVVFYGLDRDGIGADAVTPTWTAAPAVVEEGRQLFDVFAGGMACGRFALGVPGLHNVRNALAALVVATEGFGVPVTTAQRALGAFEGVRRRQDLLGEPGGVRVYDDFAHHPTAVEVTLRGLRTKHPDGRLWAVFEPRSATACRSLHQVAYASAFDAADQVILAPVGRANVPEAERLDVSRLAQDLGPKAEALPGVDAIVSRLQGGARRGDTIAVLSNGVFGGLHGKLLLALGARS